MCREFIQFDFTPITYFLSVPDAYFFNAVAVYKLRPLHRFMKVVDVEVERD